MAAGAAVPAKAGRLAGARFEEARRHLGLETQLQWSDLAILLRSPVR